MRDRAALPARKEILELGVKFDEVHWGRWGAHDGGTWLELLAGFVRLLGALGEVGEIDLEAAHISRRDVNGGSGTWEVVVNSLDIFFGGGRLVAFCLCVGRCSYLAGLALCLQVADFLDENAVDLE